MPLTYEFRLGDEPISYGTSSKSAKALFPAGLPKDGYQSQLRVIIKNTVGVAIVHILFVKVISYLI